MTTNKMQEFYFCCCCCCSFYFILTFIRFPHKSVYFCVLFLFMSALSLIKSQTNTHYFKVIYADEFVFMYIHIHTYLCKLTYIYTYSYANISENSLIYTYIQLYTYLKSNFITGSSCMFFLF